MGSRPWGSQESDTTEHTRNELPLSSARSGGAPGGTGAHCPSALTAVCSRLLLAARDGSSAPVGRRLSARVLCPGSLWPTFCCVSLPVLDASCKWDICLCIWLISQRLVL